MHLCSTSERLNLFVCLFLLNMDEMIDGILVTSIAGGGAFQLNKSVRAYLEFQAS